MIPHSPPFWGKEDYPTRLSISHSPLGMEDPLGKEDYPTNSPSPLGEGSLSNNDIPHSHLGKENNPTRLIFHTPPLGKVGYQTYLTILLPRPFGEGRLSNTPPWGRKFIQYWYHIPFALSGIKIPAWWLPRWKTGSGAVFGENKTCLRGGKDRFGNSWLTIVRFNCLLLVRCIVDASLGSRDYLF